MLHKFIISICLLWFCLVSFADEVQVSPDHPGSYTVVKGDTLWDIARRFLTEPWRWPEIWRSNPQIKDPHLIYPGDVISLGYEEGSPYLTVERGGQADEDVMRPEADRNVKLSPSIRVQDEQDAIPSIPIDAIRNFLAHPRVVEEGEMAGWPYIISSYEQHLIAGPGDRVYVRGLSPDSEAKKYSIYRKGSMYKSGDQVLGYEAIYVGEAIVDKLGEPSTLVVTQAEREVLEGDRLIAQSREDISTDIIPNQPSGAVNATIISATDVLSEIGQYQVVVIDAGVSDGIEVGNVLGVYQSGGVIMDRVKMERPNSIFKRGEKVMLPDEYAGVLLVFRTFNNISYGLVMEAIRSIHLNDAVRDL